VDVSLNVRTSYTTFEVLNIIDSSAVSEHGGWCKKSSIAIFQYSVPAGRLFMPCHEFHGIPGGKWPSLRFEIIIADLHRVLCWPMYVCVTVAVNVVCAGEQCTCETCILHDIVQYLGAAILQGQRICERFSGHFSPPRLSGSAVLSSVLTVAVTHALWPSTAIARLRENTTLYQPVHCNM